MINRAVKQILIFTGVIPGIVNNDVKVMNNKGNGSTFDIAEGIKYAADQGADIINLSLGGKGYSAIMAEAVEYRKSGRRQT